MLSARERREILSGTEQGATLEVMFLPIGLVGATGTW